MLNLLAFLIALAIINLILAYVILDRYYVCRGCGYNGWNDKYPWAPWAFWANGGSPFCYLAVIILALKTSRGALSFWPYFSGSVVCIFAIAMFVVPTLVAKYGKEEEILGATEISPEYTLAENGAKFVLCLSPRDQIERCLDDEEHEYYQINTTEITKIVQWHGIIGKIYTYTTSFRVYFIHEGTTVRKAGEGASSYVKYEE